MILYCLYYIRLYNAVVIFCSCIGLYNTVVLFSIRFYNTIIWAVFGSIMHLHCFVLCFTVRLHCFVLGFTVRLHCFVLCFTVRLHCSVVPLLLAAEVYNCNWAVAPLKCSVKSVSSQDTTHNSISNSSINLPFSPTWAENLPGFQNLNMSSVSYSYLLVCLAGTYSVSSG